MSYDWFYIVIEIFVLLILLTILYFFFMARIEGEHIVQELHLFVNNFMEDFELFLAPLPKNIKNKIVDKLEKAVDTVNPGTLESDEQIDRTNNRLKRKMLILLISASVLVIGVGTFLILTGRLNFSWNNVLQYIVIAGIGMITIEIIFLDDQYHKFANKLNEKAPDADVSAQGSFS
jgi:hypothetical protein